MDRHETATASAVVNDRLFIGIYPAGIVYADRQRDKDRNYARLAFMPFKSLVLEVERDCPPDMLRQIAADASKIIERRGQAFPISATGQTIILGKA